MRPCATTLESELLPSEREALLGVIKSNKLNSKHLEIGTAAGGTLWELMSAYSNDSRPQFVVVDSMSYFPNQRQTVEENLKKHEIDPSTVDFRVSPSDQAYLHSKRLGEKFDFIFIDAGHKIRYVTKDLLWAERLNTGGLLCFHDYCKGHRGVLYAVNRFLRRNKHFEIVKKEKSLLILRKMREPKRPEVGRSDYLFAHILAPFLQLEPSIRKRFRKLLGR